MESTDGWMVGWMDAVCASVCKCTNPSVLGSIPQCVFFSLVLIISVVNGHVDLQTTTTTRPEKKQKERKEEKEERKGCNGLE